MVGESFRERIDKGKERVKDSVERFRQERKEAQERTATRKAQSFEKKRLELGRRIALSRQRTELATQESRRTRLAQQGRPLARPAPKAPMFSNVGLTSGSGLAASERRSSAVRGPDIFDPFSMGGGVPIPPPRRKASKKKRRKTRKKPVRRRKRR